MLAKWGAWIAVGVLGGVLLVCTILGDSGAFVFLTLLLAAIAGYRVGYATGYENGHRKSEQWWEGYGVRPEGRNRRGPLGRRTPGVQEKRLGFRETAFRGRESPKDDSRGPARASARGGRT